MKQIMPALLLLLFSLSATGQGWQPEQVLYSSTQPDVEGSCGRFPNTNTNICVAEFKNPNNTLDLYEFQSTNGGVSWSGAFQITTHSESEYDAFVAPDPARGRIWLLYSRTRFPANDLFISYKTCPSCAWSSPITVIADGKNNWDASLLVLSNGHLLVLETIEGFGGTGPGLIRSIRSANAGTTWGAPTVIFNETGEETYPVALQKFDGVIHLMFRDTSHGSGTQIGQLWSSDQGLTWTGHSVFSYSSQQKQFTFIGTQGGQNITVLASLLVGSVWRVHHWQSSNNGITWQGPFLTVTTSSNTQDAEFSLGCRGPIFTFTNGFQFRGRRYDWYTSCQ